MTLALDEVVEPGVGVVRLDQRLQERLTVLRQDEVLERCVIPDNRLDVLDVELDCLCSLSCKPCNNKNEKEDSRHVLSAKLNP